MTLFDEREKGFEAKYHMEQEAQFKVNIRRDKLLGLWAAEKLGLVGDEAKAYALTVVDAEFSEPDHDVCHKVSRDFTAQGIDLPEAVIRKEMGRLQVVAMDQIGQELEKK